MNNRFKKTALAVASGLGLMALVPSAFCDREVKLDPFHMQIVGKYFGSSEDIVNLEMVNSKFKDMGKIYTGSTQLFMIRLFSRISKLAWFTLKKSDGRLNLKIGLNT